MAENAAELGAVRYLSRAPRGQASRRAQVPLSRGGRCRFHGSYLPFPRERVLMKRSKFGLSGVPTSRVKKSVSVRP